MPRSTNPLMTIEAWLAAANRQEVDRLLELSDNTHTQYSHAMK